VKRLFRGLSQAVAPPKVGAQHAMHLSGSLEFDLVGTKDQIWPHSPTVERPDSFLRDMLQALQAHRGSQPASRVPILGRRSETVAHLPSPRSRYQLCEAYKGIFSHFEDRRSVNAIRDRLKLQPHPPST